RRRSRCPQCEQRAWTVRRWGGRTSNRRSARGSGSSASVSCCSRRPRASTLFPYTTLFRSLAAQPVTTNLLKFMRRKSGSAGMPRSEERFSRNAETDLVCRLLLEKKKGDRDGRRLPGRGDDGKDEPRTDARPAAPAAAHQAR